VYLTAYISGGNLTPEISTDTINFIPWVSPLVVPAGMAETPPFRFRYPSVGHVTLRAEAVSFPTVSQSRFAWYDFDVISGTVAFKLAVLLLRRLCLLYHDLTPTKAVAKSEKQC
jgi:hypothetical protein